MTRQFQDIVYSKADGIAKVIINRPRVVNAFRPLTIDEMLAAFQDAWRDDAIGVVILSGAGGNFCSGGDQKIRGEGGYNDESGMPRLHVRELHRLIREIPKPVVAMVDGYCIGGGHVLHVLCDLTIASTRAKFGQTGPKVGSFDAGFGSILLARIIGHKRAREVWYLCRQYTAQEAYEMGLVNKVVPPEHLEEETMEWSREMLAKSPTALRFLKYSFNADTDHIYGIQAIAHSATSLFYTTDESKEGRRAFLEKRNPDFSKYRKHPW